MNVTVVVPSNPLRLGSDPSFWYGLQTANGTGALIQPVLAWSQSSLGSYSIFHEVYDWNNRRDYRSPETYDVPEGDILTQSVTYRAEDNSYDMYIASSMTGKSISWNYQLQTSQTVPESTAFVVVEHQPHSCDMFPASGGITFFDVTVDVDYQRVSPTWVAKQEVPACNSLSAVLDESSVSLTWDPDA